MNLPVLLVNQFAFLQVRTALTLAEATAVLWYNAVAILWDNFGRHQTIWLQERSKTLDEIQQDHVSVSLEFGALTFLRENGRTFAQTDMTATFTGPVDGDGSTSLRMEVRVEADPERESILAIVEKSRRRAIDQLKTVTTQIDAETAETLLFGPTNDGA